MGENEGIVDAVKAKSYGREDEWMWRSTEGLQNLMTEERKLTLMRDRLQPEEEKPSVDY